MIRGEVETASTPPEADAVSCTSSFRTFDSFVAVIFSISLDIFFGGEIETGYSQLLARSVFLTDTKTHHRRHMFRPCGAVASSVCFQAIPSVKFWHAVQVVHHMQMSPLGPESDYTLSSTFACSACTRSSDTIFISAVKKHKATAHANRSV